MTKIRVIKLVFALLWRLGLSHLLIFNMVAILLIISLILLLIIKGKRKPENTKLLTKLIETEIKNTKPRNPLSLILSQTYLPSWKSLITIAIVPAVVFLISHFFTSEKSSYTLMFNDDNHYQNLIAILAGIAAIIFPLIILVAESLRDDDDKDRARVLLKESYIYPLVVGTILSFFVFIWGDINIFGIVLILFIGVGTIYSISKLIRLLLDPTYFSQKKIELLKDRVAASIDLEMSKRIGNNILLSKLEGKPIKLKYLGAFGDDEDAGYHRLLSHGSGIVNEINLQKLQELSDIIEIEANKNGYSFLKNEAKKNLEFVNNKPEAKEIETELFRESQKRYLHKSFLDKIEDGDLLLSIDNAIVKDSAIIHKIDIIINQAYMVGKGTNSLELELSGVKDRFLKSINEKALSAIESLSDTYISVIESFLESLKKYGGGYGRKQASGERHSLFGGWQQIKSISRDISDIIGASIESKNIRVINETTPLIYRSIMRAIDFNDQYIFQEYIHMIETVYYWAVENDDEKIKKLLSEKCWRYLEEISKYKVISQLKKPNKPKEEITILKDFVVYFYLIFMNLMRTAYLNNREDDFKKFAGKASSLADRFNPSEDTTDSEMLKLQLERQNLNDNDRKDLEELLEKQTFMEGIESEIELYKNQMFFGLASWVLSKTSHGDAEQKKKSTEFYEILSGYLPTDVSKLLKVYASCREIDSDRFWGWDWWDIIPDGLVRSIDTNSKFDHLFAVTSIKNLTADPSQAAVIDPNREIAYLAEDSSPLNLALDEIRKGILYNSIVSPENIEKIDAIKNMLKKAKQDQEKIESAHLRESGLDKKKVEEFIEQLSSSYGQSAAARNIFKFLGLLENTKPDKISGDFGINNIDDKGAFIADWYVHFGDWGEHYGHDLAAGENKLILGKLVQKAENITSEKEMWEQIDTCSNPIIIATGASFYHFFGYSKDKSEIKSHTSYYAGRYKGSIPIFHVPTHDEDLVLILNKDRIGKLKQYMPISPVASQNNSQHLIISVKAFSEDSELLDSYIKEPPKWLNKYKTKVDKENFLKEKVGIQILEKFEVEFADDFKGYVFKEKDE